MTIKLTENAKKTALELINKGRKVYANTDGHLFTGENSAKLSKKEYKEVSEADINKKAEDNKK